MHVLYKCTKKGVNEKCLVILGEREQKRLEASKDWELVEDGSSDLRDSGTITGKIE